MIDLLRQISLQTSNYSFVAGRLTSAVMPNPSASTFHPSVAAIRVNVCWFASLVLSLSAASFGMLVQQWLREYLYIDRTVPQERIRIRHFRSHGLEVWKLFEIAAVLPLILQISLALFFTGLCFFTASVHPSIGTATLFLVSGWAALFGFALLAPLISPRCPYKTTFLKAAFRRVRSLVRNHEYPSRTFQLLTGLRRFAAFLKIPSSTCLRFLRNPSMFKQMILPLPSSANMSFPRTSLSPKRTACVARIRTIWRYSTRLMLKY